MPQLILDSHIHLWPGTAANPQSHGWMHPGAHLTRQYSIKDYLIALSASDNHVRKYNVAGFVYVETDRVVGQIDTGDADVQNWAAEPLNEIAFLRRIVEGKPGEGKEFVGPHFDLLKAIVAWAPFHRGFTSFSSYLTVAKEVAGHETWSRIKGFRFLLQGIRDEGKYYQLVSSPNFVEILQHLGKEGLSFDVGVDQRQGGIWQLEHFANVIEMVHDGVLSREKTVFILSKLLERTNSCALLILVLDHLCKPDMEQAPTTNKTKKRDFERWKLVISRFAKHEKVYMKLSGAFSEIADQDPENPLSLSIVLERMKPWLDHVFSEFGPGRIMFGSDWPVCNVRGPGDAKSWGHWVEVVDQFMQTRGFSKGNMDRVWFGTGVEAYRLQSMQ